MGGGSRKGPDKLLCILDSPEPKDLLDKLRKKHPNIQISFYHGNARAGASHHTEDVPEDLWRDVTIIATFTWTALPSSPSAAPNLDLIHVFSAGIDRLADHPLYKDGDITFTTSSGIHGPRIAEWVVMTALVQSHKYNLLHDLQRQKKWGSGELSRQVRSTTDLVGQRLGVLGYGSIGRQVARVAKAMGMDVVAFTATPKDTLEKKRDHGYIIPGTGDPDGVFPSAWYSGLDTESLHEFLKQDIDILLVSVPLTKETTHFLSTSEFAALRPNRTVLVNISRGPVVDQEALVTALRDGVLRGAALDVTDPEPLPEDSPLWEMDNVIITPHISGIGSAYMERAFDVLDVNLGRRERGEKLINVIDKRRGYAKN